MLTNIEFVSDIDLSEILSADCRINLVLLLEITLEDCISWHDGFILLSLSFVNKTVPSVCIMLDMSLLFFAASFMGKLFELDEWMIFLERDAIRNSELSSIGPPNRMKIKIL
jgi:hypothetical protein